MVKTLSSSFALGLFTLSLVGSVLAEDFRGSGRGTTLEGVSDRSGLAEGQRVNVTFDENEERKTASKIAIRK